MPSLDEVRTSLGAYEPRVLPIQGRRRAAVAIVLREVASRPEVLLIERAEREGDPWSGHMAFPGGRWEPSDRDSRAAAERETSEEVGISLAGAHHLGRLDDLEGHPGGSQAMLISAFVYHLPEPSPIVPNREVREAFWFSLRALLEPGRHVDYSFPRREGFSGGSFPGIRVGRPDRHIVWGLTYRFLEVFLRIAGRPLPERNIAWSGDQEAPPPWKPSQRSTGSGG